MPVIACHPSSTSSAGALRAMFEARKRVFVDLLGWDLPVLAGLFEVDQFDDEHAEYLILSDDDNSHLASTRLLRTDRPHLLADLFAHLCDEPPPHGPAVREITRFCLDPRPRAGERKQARDCLVTALVEHALVHGISEYTGVATLGWYEQVARFGWDCRTLAASKGVGPGKLVALHIRIDESTPERMKGAGVFTPDFARKFAA